MADGPAPDIKTAPPPAETQTGKGADNRTDTPGSAEKSAAEKTKTQAVVLKLRGFFASGKGDAGLREVAAIQPETNDTKAAVASPSAEAGQPKAAQESQAADTDTGTKVLDTKQTSASEDSTSPSEPKGEKPKDEDADLKNSLSPSDYEEYKLRAAKIAEPGRRFGGLLRPSAKAQNQYTNARQDLKQEYLEKHASALADQDARAASENQTAGTTAVTSGETTNQPADTAQAMPENASAEDLQNAFDASTTDAADIPAREQLSDPADATAQTEKPTEQPQQTTQEKIADLKARLDTNEITQDEYTKLATEAVSEDVTPSAKSTASTLDSNEPNADKPFGPEAPETPHVPDTVNEVVETFAETAPAADPIAEADAETEAKTREARRGTDDRYQELVLKMLETNGDPTRMPVEDQRELVRYQEARLEDMREGLRAADASVPIESGPTGPATPEDMLTKSGVTPEQLADILNSPQGEALAQAMQENPEQAQAILKEIAKAQEMQTQLKALCEAQGWPFDAKQGMEFALGRIAAQLGNEMASDDTTSGEARKKWTVLKVLLLALGIPLVIAAAAVAAEATFIQAGAAMAKQAA